MVEGARLESVYSGNAIAGSNPALSAKQYKCPKGHFFIFKIPFHLLIKHIVLEKWFLSTHPSQYKK